MVVVPPGTYKIGFEILIPMTFKDCIYHIQFEQKSTVADTVAGFSLFIPLPLAIRVSHSSFKFLLSTAFGITRNMRGGLKVHSTSTTTVMTFSTGEIDI